MTQENGDSIHRSTGINVCAPDDSADSPLLHSLIGLQAGPHGILSTPPCERAVSSISNTISATCSILRPTRASGRGELPVRDLSSLFCTVPTCVDCSSPCITPGANATRTGSGLTTKTYVSTTLWKICSPRSRTKRRYWKNWAFRSRAKTRCYW